MLTKRLPIKLHFPNLNFPKLEMNQKGNIVQVYEKLTGNKVRKFGAVFMVLCPFHEERTPSMALYPGTSSYHCFGCDTSGDTITLVRKIKDMTFSEALEELKKI